MAVSFQCMTKFTTNKKKWITKKKKKRNSGQNERFMDKERIREELKYVI